MILKYKAKKIKNETPCFDGFDSNGKLTANKCILCIHQSIKCPYQSFFGEGALLICTYTLEKCFKDDVKDKKEIEL